MFRSRKKIAAGLGAVVIAGTAGLIGLAPSAYAGTEVTINNLCKTVPPLQPDINGTLAVTIGSPVEVEIGAGGTITADFKDGKVGDFPASALGQDLDITPQLDIKLSNGSTVTVTAAAKHFKPVAGDVMTFGTLSGTWAGAPAAGAVTFTPDILRIHTEVAGGAIKTDTTCTPTSPVAVSSSTNVVAPKPVPRVDSLTPNHGQVPVNVTVNASNFTPNASAFLVGLDAANAQTGDIAPVTVGADGKVTGTIAITKENTTQIAVSEGAPPANNAVANFRVDPPSGGGLQQNPGGDVLPGPLAMQQAASGVSLSPITINGKPQTMNGKLNTVAVQDFRGGTLGWSLTAKSTDFTSDTNGTISKDRFEWTPACAVTNPDSPSAVKTGTAGKVDNSTLCSQAANAPGQVSGGEFSANADLKLSVPAFQLAGTYTAVVTLSLA